MENFTSQELITELRRRGHAVKSWQREDVISQLKDDEDSNLTDEQIELIADEATTTSEFALLEDCTSDDWDLVTQSITSACEALGIDY